MINKITIVTPIRASMSFHVGMYIILITKTLIALSLSFTDHLQSQTGLHTMLCH